MKRVCLIRQKYYPYQRNLRRSAETLLKEGYQVDIICVGSKGQKKHEIVNGVNVLRIYYLYHRDNVFWYFYDYLTFFLLAFIKLTWLSLKKRYDVIEVHTMPDFLVFTAVFAKMLGSKVILYMFENTELLFTSGYGMSKKHIFTRILRFIAKISAGYADKVIVSDGPLHKKAVEGYGIRGEKITLVLNVPDESVFKSEPALISKKSNQFNITIISSILKRYGLQVMVNAIPLLSKDIPEVKIYIVGEGEYLPYLKQLAQKLGIEQHVTFTGMLPYEEVPNLISKADVCVAPMINDVGAPNKIFEYAALSKPIIASELPGISSVFKDGSVRYFTPGNERELADKIIELYHGEEQRNSLGISAHEVYCKFRWSVMKQTYLSVYKQLLK